MQQVEASLWVPAISALCGALIGAAAVLIAQLIAAKTKKQELFFNARAQAYGEALAAAATYALDITDENYQRWRRAHGAAFLFASDEVKAALTDKQDGIDGAVLMLRAARTDVEQNKVQVTVYYNAINRVTDAMRKDLRG